MSLAQQVKDRYPDSFLVPITNPDDPDASAIDDDRLGLACDDTLGDFLVYVGAAYDETNAAHVTVAVDGVVFHLRQRLGQGDLSGDRTVYTDRLKALASGQGGRVRANAATKTEMTVDEENTRRTLRKFLPDGVVMSDTED